MMSFCDLGMTTVLIKPRMDIEEAGFLPAGLLPHCF